MKRLGAIIITFYFAVFIYIVIYRPVVIAGAIFSLALALLITSFIRDIMVPVFKQLKNQSHAKLG